MLNNRRAPSIVLTFIALLSLAGFLVGCGGSGGSSSGGGGGASSNTSTITL